MCFLWTKIYIHKDAHPSIAESEQLETGSSARQKPLLRVLLFIVTNCA